jgi:hypothetical protein
MDRPACDIISDLLHLDLSPTVRGDEAKGYCPDPDGPGRTTMYLNRAECEVLSRAFARLAEELNVQGHVKLY